MTQRENFYDGRTVLVTGAGGFIASHLTEALVRQGAHVRALVKYNSRNDWGHIERLPESVQQALEIHTGDITDPFLMRRLCENVDTVFHLAALIGIPYSYIAPQHYVSVNVTGTLNVLEAARSEGIRRLVHTSTSETYGTALYTPIDEKHPLQGQSPYSASKIAADQLVDSYYRSFSLPATTIRPFNTYGPRQSARAIIPTIISQALTGQPIVLGSLAPQRDFTYVSDTVAGFLAVGSCDAALGHVTNVGSGFAVSIGETVEMILKILNQPSHSVQADDPERVRPEQSEVGLLLCNNQMAKERLNWQPTVSFEEGLSLTIDAIRHSLSAYKTTVYNV
ncbi:MAG: SDR family NAD(P)-dependent oxidoreductase [Cyanobacteria bacterium]|nr:SDR family NAD(P)-dependent oxidoreductase [Cyanobacteriota bacterium]